jgi:dinuclear metal center YbgI/SA1388 family protein
MTRPTVRSVVDWLDRFAPPATAASWDNVGLLLGDPASPCGRVLTCLTLTADVAAEAIRDRADLIVSHHPLPFKPTAKLVATNGDGRVLWPLAKAGIAVHSPHTAFDNCPGGINDGLAKRFGLTNVAPLRREPKDGQFKVTVFVPEGDLAKVSDAMFAAGAGRIGANDRYTECGFRVAGTGTFRPGAHANPTIGTIGQREEVTEYRLETVVPKSKLLAVVAALKAAHSYEEPAYDLYPVTVIPDGGQGRIGTRPAISLGDFASDVKRLLKAPATWVVGEPTNPLSKIAVACGAAGEFLSDAIAAGADCFVTGELRFHDALKARDAGLACVVPGHYATERPGVEDLATMIASNVMGVTAWASAVERDPFSSPRPGVGEGERLNGASRDGQVACE